MSEHGADGDILKINGNLLMATICGGGAYLIWPSSIEWWGMGFLSILLGISSAELLGRSFGLMRKHKLFANYAAKRAAPKSATLASPEAMRDAGMM